MEKAIHEKQIAMLMSKSKDQLVRELLTYQRLESQDRMWANECASGSAVNHINNLFHKLHLAELDPSTVNILELFEDLDLAGSAWASIRSTLLSIADDSRCEKSAKEVSKIYTSLADSESSNPKSILMSEIESARNIARNLNKAHSLSILVANSDEVIASAGLNTDNYVNMKLSTSFIETMRTISLFNMRVDGCIFPCSSDQDSEVLIAKRIICSDEPVAYIIVLSNQLDDDTNWDELRNDVVSCSHALGCMIATRMISSKSRQ